mmetsp:Transcript_2429/g.3494  ORF Transcript_2429/g.3494 Transcript_2429/m.3494 type:complete len:108 (+) Transcript_2429:92-415(+)|eukprot:CAMPEP_0167745050 /NCGR_PEP_ID=MMETSP0110_2-20121227/2934_1 /TAXON_ID=629695 /ORGANISM="Gymnochlora sp., Strain CCMP2014" /LENGTH=107 /DNA_ID=CAMNT_0007629645 /DNA_START=57 /DNA_END=380 /DNA_ORIENTATION=+
MSESKATVQSIIKSNPAVVFSASWCPYCKKAKALLSDLKATVKVIETDEDPNGSKYKQQLLGLTGRTSVPAVFVGGKFIGGCNDGPGVYPLHRAGKLVPMLKDAGAL